MSTHDLKIWPEFFVVVACGAKTAEIRRDDRGYKVGDILLLREWEPTTERYSGRSCRRRVSHVLHGMGNVGVIAPQRGLNLHYVMLSLQSADGDEMEKAA
jgi:hypothetical protein